MSQKVGCCVGEQSGWVDVLDDELNSLSSLSVDACAGLDVLWYTLNHFHDQGEHLLEKGYVHKDAQDVGPVLPDDLKHNLHEVSEEHEWSTKALMPLLTNISAIDSRSKSKEEVIEG